ncbi:hypothetical protein C8J56DRAFT_892544 [Mycena floridula]|nr:hypothetical protein C8J56DRAFT_892544 [Mycena floridula]
MISASLETKDKHLGIIRKLFAEPEPKRAEHLSGLLSTYSLNDLKCKAKKEFDIKIQKIQSSQESEEFKVALEHALNQAAIQIELYEEWVPIFENLDAEVQKQTVIRNQNIAIHNAEIDADMLAIATDLMVIADVEAQIEDLSMTEKSWERNSEGIGEE